MTRTAVGILIFDDVEVLDFAGPYEVFSRTRTEPGPASRKSEDSAPFHVFTVAKTAAPIRATGGLAVTPDHDFDGAPDIDIVVVPGGFGTRDLLDDATTLDWIRATAGRAAHVTSVRTGSLLFAKLGLLAGERATTHWGAHDLLETIDPTVVVVRDCRFVDDGLVTSAGVSAGIDMAFHVVERICGIEVANETAHYMDYRRV